jgi:hypothetical protein
MRRLVGGAVLLLAFLPALWAQDDKDKKPDKKTPAEELKALQAEVKAAQDVVRKSYTDAKTDEERQAVIKKFYAIPQTYAKRALELAQKNARDQVCYDAVSWMITSRVTGPDMDAAADLVIKHHAEKLSKLAPMLARATSGSAEKLLKANVETSKEPPAIAQAKLHLAKFHKNFADVWEPVGGRDPAKAAADAEKLLTEIVAKYADVATVLKQAKADLEEIQKLGIGKTVPEVEGEDLDGKKFKLSDYRGKVVLIDFWGHW